MNIVIRTDAYAAIGTGHLMRCLALAKALANQHQITFLCNSLAPALVATIHTAGFELLLLPQVPADEAEQAQTCLALLRDKVDLLIVDHYQLGAAFCQHMRSRCAHILVIDDLANRVHDCDLLLDQNFLPDMQRRYRQLVPATCQCLLGPAYVLLRQEFYVQPAQPRSHVFVFFGGADEKNITRRALLALTALGEAMPAVDVVLGGANPWIAELTQEFSDNPLINWHINCDYMAQLMARAHLSLGAGGGTHWERAIMGVPSLVVTVADNQQATTAYLASLGACRWLGDDSITVEDFKIALNDALQSPQQLLELAANARKILPANAGIPQVVGAINEILG